MQLDTLILASKMVLISFPIVIIVVGFWWLFMEL